VLLLEALVLRAVRVQLHVLRNNQRDVPGRVILVVASALNYTISKVIPLNFVDLEPLATDSNGVLRQNILCFDPVELVGEYTFGLSGHDAS
jgi:hypothetical protein